MRSLCKIPPDTLIVSPVMVWGCRSAHPADDHAVSASGWHWSAVAWPGIRPLRPAASPAGQVCRCSLLPRSYPVAVPVSATPVTELPWGGAETGQYRFFSITTSTAHAARYSVPLFAGFWLFVALGVEVNPGDRRTREDARSAPLYHTQENQQAMARHILVIDQGTTSTRTIVFDAAVAPVATAQQELTQLYPKARLGRARPGGDLGNRPGYRPAGLVGCRTHRVGDCLLWASPTSGRRWWFGTVAPAGPSTTPLSGRIAVPLPCARHLKSAGHEALIATRTGLRLDPYFSATKIAWLLDNVEGARAAAEAGSLAFGTVDSFLLWRLTGGARSCNRRHQRLANAAVRHPSRRMGSRSAGAV